MLCFGAVIGNMFPDAVLRKSEGGMKEYEKESFGIFAPRFDRMRFWTDCSGGILSDFAASGCCTGPDRGPGLLRDIFFVCPCVCCRRHECHLSDGTNPADGSDFDSWQCFIYQLFGHLPA